MRTDGPVIDVDEQAKELLSKEIAVVGLMEINTIGREDAGKVCSTRVKGQIGLEESSADKISRRGCLHGSRGNRFCWTGIEHDLWMVSYREKSGL
jgi:hypothetical protein